MVSAVRRGQVYWVGFDPVVGCEQGGVRPAVVIQNDVGNRHAQTTIVAAITSARRLDAQPYAAPVSPGLLPRPSVVNCAQLRTIDQTRLRGEPIAVLDPETMSRVDDALRVSLGIRLGPADRRGR